MDTQAKHTAEPWSYDGMGAIVGGPVIGGTRETIAIMPPAVGAGIPHMTANAHMLTAAARMYDALRALLIETNQHADSGCPKLRAACDAARAALAHAEGR